MTDATTTSTTTTTTTVNPPQQGLFTDQETDHAAAETADFLKNGWNALVGGAKTVGNATQDVVDAAKRGSYHFQCLEIKALVDQYKTVYAQGVQIDAALGKDTDFPKSPEGIAFYKQFNFWKTFQQPVPQSFIDIDQRWAKITPPNKIPDHDAILRGMKDGINEAQTVYTSVTSNKKYAAQLAAAPTTPDTADQVKDAAGNIIKGAGDVAKSAADGAGNLLSNLTAGKVGGGLLGAILAFLFGQAIMPGIGGMLLGGGLACMCAMWGSQLGNKYIDPMLSGNHPGTSATPTLGQDGQYHVVAIDSPTTQQTSTQRNYSPMMNSNVSFGGSYMNGGGFLGVQNNLPFNRGQRTVILDNRFR